jgi:hypothetical protein
MMYRATNNSGTSDGWIAKEPAIFFDGVRNVQRRRIPPVHSAGPNFLEPARCFAAVGTDAVIRRRRIPRPAALVAVGCFRAPFSVLVPVALAVEAMLRICA